MLNAKEVEGSWNWVASRYPDERMQSRVFKLWFDHGINPKNKKYEYMLIPKTAAAQMDDIYNSNPYKIGNTMGLQQVIKKDGSLAALIFYDAGKSKAIGGMEVSDPCVVLVKNNSDRVDIAIADPTQKLENILFKINGQFKGDQVKLEKNRSILNVKLPSGGQSGNTVQVTLMKI